MLISFTQYEISFDCKIASGIIIISLNHQEKSLSSYINFRIFINKEIVLIKRKFSVKPKNSNIIEKMHL